MKKLSLLLGCALACMNLSAQTNISGNKGPVKLDDVVALYKKLHPSYGTQTNLLNRIIPGYIKENQESDYHFNRWLWYAKQHVDMNGNLVSPAKTWDEWKKMQLKQKHVAEKTTANSPAWTFQGPDSSQADGEGVGRINTVSFHPTDANTYWIGSAGGGAWKTTNNGLSWTCMTDQLPVLSVSDVQFNPLNANTVYICSGDRDGGDYAGVGVLKSYNGGASWNTTGITWTPDQYNVANALLVNPLDTNSLILATSVGMYRSFDGGNTWATVHTGNFKQILYRPNDTNTVYATSYIDYSAWPTVTNAQVWRSQDGGTTWTQQTNLTTTDRMTIAVTPAAPNIVMAIGSAYDASGSNSDGLDGIYKSSDSGSTFNEIYMGGCTGNLLTWDAAGDGCGGQGWYTLPLAISPVDSNIVYTGGVNGWSSPDGGLSWNIMSQWSFQLTGVITVHADKHCMTFNPLLPNRLFETNDGGIYYSDNPTSTGLWNNITNRMGIEEIYRTSVSNIASFEIVGAQDVGTKLVHTAGRYVVADGGDGMACLLDFADSTVAYASSEQGYIDILDPTAPDPTLTATDISMNIAGGSVEGTGGWVTPFVLEPSCHSCILAGYQKIYKSTDKGSTWTTISAQLTSRDIYRIATTKADANTIFATDDDYNQTIFYTHDGGVTWSTLVGPYPGSQFISDIKVDPRDKNHIWVTFSGYGSAQVAEWHATTGWSQINSGLPDIPVSCIAVDYLSRDLYIGTDIGVFYKDSTASGTWHPYMTGMPSISVTDIEINYATNQLWAATYGRSLWKSVKRTNTSLLGVSIVPFANDGITIAPNPSTGSFTASVKNLEGKTVTMRIIDNTGKTVWQATDIVKGNALKINTSSIVPGNYLFEITDGNSVVGRQKIVIE